ncbi:MAG TPA: hydantoinase/oxoprolinase family protein [Acetobacteraceae bacterium]|jgi:N-methylhydantoinase A|nr:hydantoinase/oxoprolinase family protein [Acetobacteraceae bacterium]
MRSADLIVAVDIGGTFTDVTLADRATGQLWRAKTPSTPADPSEAFLVGVLLALADADAQPTAVDRVLHGTTVATNLILEGKTARTALVTTSGFRHVLEIGRQDIPRHANLFAWVKPQRPVPPARVLEVTERVGPGGIVLMSLDEASVHDVATTLRRLDVQSVAICLLHSFAYPAHERRVAEMLRAALPEIAITASVDVLPVAREYERSLATIMNAGVMPAVTTYVTRLQRRLADADITAPLLLMQSNGGVAGAATIGRAPALTVLSGPAAGVVGARDVAAASGIGDIVTVDIGGTSADICLLRGGQIQLTQRGRIGEWPLSLPMVDMVTIGAGGGSIARLSDDALTVGPASAGAMPGPACYGTGGEEPTVTDAHLVLGHLPTSLLGGRLTLDTVLAAQAIRVRVAEPLGLSLHDAARGILAIADSNMVGAIRVVSVERGHDPRDFTLVPFGGAGPLHGCALAELLGVTRVLVPPAPGVLCAEGLLAAALKSEFSRTLPRPDEWDAADAVFAALEQEANAWFDTECVAADDRKTTRVALLRYEGQGSELAIVWPGGAAAAQVVFADAHQALNGFALDAKVELVTLRVEAEGSVPAPPRPALTAGAGAKPIARQVVHSAAGSVEALVYDRAELGAGDRFDGPAIVTQLDATTLVSDGWQAEMLASGALMLRRSERAGP